MEWVTLAMALLRLGSYAVQEVEKFKSQDVPGSKKKEIATNLVLGGLGMAKNMGEIDQGQHAVGSALAIDAVQFAFDALNLGGVVNKDKSREMNINTVPITPEEAT